MDLASLVGEARSREPRPLGGRERLATGALAAAFLAAAFAVRGLLPPDRRVSVALVVGLVVLHALAERSSFEIGTGTASPAQLTFVPLLFLAPLSLVPLLVAAAGVLSRVPSFVTRKSHPDRWLWALVDAFYALGPVAVLGVLAPGPPTDARLGIYAIALAAQVGTGIVAWVVGEVVVYGGSVRDSLRIVVWSQRIDIMLAPIAYLAAIEGYRRPLMLLGILPLLWLLRVFAKEREQRHGATLELQDIYRGTVMVLSDVVEADDHYTASHCRSVVELASTVGSQLGLDREQLQEIEIVALLHDVGKIAIPNQILNKPARLTDEEFELMKTHTIEGQALLERVGGRLAQIGGVVRSCHERWDGCGYPDGLASDQIPLSARIVFCCDAYSAMTTERPYRAAMTPEQALTELTANAGSQFDPTIVRALEQLVRSGLEATLGTYSDAVRAVIAGQSLPTAPLGLSV